MPLQSLPRNVGSSTPVETLLSSFVHQPNQSGRAFIWYHHHELRPSHDGIVHRAWPSTQMQGIGYRRLSRVKRRDSEPNGVPPLPSDFQKTVCMWGSQRIGSQTWFQLSSSAWIVQDQLLKPWAFKTCIHSEEACPPVSWASVPPEPCGFSKIWHYYWVIGSDNKGVILIAGHTFIQLLHWPSIFLWPNRLLPKIQ